MPFVLSAQKRNVAFDMTTGGPVEFDVTSATCILDIHSNMSINMGDYKIEDLEADGNFSAWVKLEDNQGVAVTGLASCGAVLVANQDFSKVAAAHMGGDAHFHKGWCKELKTHGVTPHFMLWGTGPEGNHAKGAETLLEYQQTLGKFQSGAAPLPPSRCHVVAACGAIFLVRSTRGVACASHDTTLPFKCRGQAVRGTTPLPSQEESDMHAYYTMENSYNTDKTMDHMMMIHWLADVVKYPEKIELMRVEADQRKIIALHGKQITKAYADRLPAALKGRFLNMKIFQAYPDWKQ